MPAPAPPPSAPPTGSLPRPVRLEFAGGTGGVARTGRARCSARVSRGRYAQRSSRVHAPSQLDARDPQNAGNRGRDSSPVPPQVPGRALPVPHPCPRAPNSVASGRLLGARRSLRGRVLESSRLTAVRGAAGKCSLVPHTPSTRLLLRGAGATVGRLPQGAQGLR